MPTQTSGSYSRAHAALRRNTGIVIPVHFNADVPVDRAEAIVRETASAFAGHVQDPKSICLSSDGSGVQAETAESVSRELGVGFVCSERNVGKLHALRPGVAELLPNPDLSYFATIDQDGDHFANELINFLRVAQHVEQLTGTDRVLALGRRISLCRPLGFRRAELEKLASRILLHALEYHAAQAGRPLRLEFAGTLDEVPDFHSGYKLLTRKTAGDVFASGPEPAGLSDDCYYRHAVEAVTSVEALTAGAFLAVINRSTLDEQPVSSFRALDRCRLTADMIVWPCRRLGVPPAFVDQWLRNHMPRLRLVSLAPDGPEQLRTIHKLVLEDMGWTPEDELPYDCLSRPEFI